MGVIDYDKLRQRWLVQKLTPDERVLDEHGKPVVNKGLRADGFRKLQANQYWIHRIHLQFMAEDPRNFADRVESAYVERRATEAFIRYQFYVDSMPRDGVIELDNVALRRVIDWTKSATSSKTL